LVAWGLVCASPVGLAAETDDLRLASLAEQYETTASADLLPSAVLQWFGGRRALADAGEPMRETDVQETTRRLPARRFVLGGCTESRCYVHFTWSTRTLTECVAFFELSRSDAAYEWGGCGGPRAATFAQLRAAIDRGEFDAPLVLRRLPDDDRGKSRKVAPERLQ
jgi:hypothetical protein